MINQFSRTELLFGNDAMLKLQKAHIAIFGLGGVGSYVAEALARCGIGALDIIDNDSVSLSNLNRQLIATHSTLGLPKVVAEKNRLKDINPNIIINTFETFYLPENSDSFNFSQYDYIVDAIDTVKAKIDLVLKANQAQTPIISSMGTGNKINPTMFKVDDIYKTKVCPLARVMRTELKKMNIKHLKVVYSEEIPIKMPTQTEEISKKRSVPASNSFCPAVAGLILASEVVKDIAQIHN